MANFKIRTGFGKFFGKLWTATPIVDRNGHENSGPANRRRKNQSLYKQNQAQMTQGKSFSHNGKEHIQSNAQKRTEGRMAYRGRKNSAKEAIRKGHG